MTKDDKGDKKEGTPLEKQKNNDPTKEKEQGKGEQTVHNERIGEITGNSYIISGGNLYVGEDRGQRIGFTRAMCKTIPEGELLEVQGSYIGEKELINDLARRLREQRVLVITGEPDSGKRTTALMVANQLKWRFDEHLNEPRQLTRLRQNVRIDIIRDLIGDDDMHNRVLLFIDALVTRNPDLIAFLDDLHKHTLVEVAGKLRAAGMFLIFTIDSAMAASSRSRLKDLAVVAELEPLSDNLLRQALCRELKGFREANDSVADGLAAVVGFDKESIILKGCRTVPRIIKFVKQYLPRIIQEQLTVEQAIERLDNLEHWFCEELASDPDLWSFAFTLVLVENSASSDEQYYDGTPWFEFERLRRTVWRCLRRNPLLFGTEIRCRTKEALIDNYFLEWTGATYSLDDATGTHLVRFKEDSYRERLWALAIHKYRSVLGCLLQELKRTTELQEFDSSHLTARIIGRIGEVDPGNILGCAYSWALAESDLLREASAFILRTAFVSRNENYRSIAIKALRHWSSSDNVNILTTVVTTYALIGLNDLEYAMKEMGRIVHWQFNYVYRNGIEAEGFSRCLKESTHVFFSSYEKGLLLTLRGALVYLCTFGDPVQVLSRLRQWMVASRRFVAPLIAFLCFCADGIGHYLERPSGGSDEDSANSGDFEAPSPIVSSLSKSATAPAELSDFLAEAYEGLCLLPVDSRVLIKRSFFSLLKRWVRVGSVSESSNIAVETALAELLLPSRGRIAKDLYDFLTTDSAFSGSEAQFQSFVTAVRKRLVSTLTREP